VPAKSGPGVVGRGRTSPSNRVFQPLRVAGSGDEMTHVGAARRRDQPVVLLVEPGERDRDQLGAWLEEAGFETLVCPGPSAPEYTCVASSGQGCPLARSADIVVLDLWLDSDRVMRGTSSRQLLRYYIRAGRPVVALMYRPDRARLDQLFLTDPVTWIDWPADRRELVETVRGVLRDQTMHPDPGLVVLPDGALDLAITRRPEGPSAPGRGAHGPMRRGRPRPTVVS
jgi:hypothetical protein